MLPRQPVVISNSTWSRIWSDSKSRIRSSRGNSLHSSRSKTLQKSHQTETCRHESRGRENRPARNHPRESPRRESRRHRNRCHRKRRHAPRQFQRRPRERGQSQQWLLSLTTCGSCNPPFTSVTRFIIGSQASMRAPGETATPKEMSGLLEYVSVGLECDWAVAGDAIGNGYPNKSLKPKLGFAHRIHCGAGWNKRRRAPVSIGMARQARRPASNGDPLQWVYRPALTLASTLMRSENEHLIRRQRCSGAIGRCKPRT